MHNLNYCYCINIGCDIGPPAVLSRYRSVLVKITLSVADILADPIIGTALVIVAVDTCTCSF